MSNLRFIIGLGVVILVVALAWYVSYLEHKQYKKITLDPNEVGVLIEKGIENGNQS